MVVDCRSLIEFCRSFDHHHHHHHHHRRSSATTTTKRSSSSRSPPPSSCDHSPSAAAADVLLLLLVLGAFLFLLLPFLKTLPSLISSLLSHAAAAYLLLLILALAFTVAAWEIVRCQCRKCGSPYCRGLRKAVEFDIQLESEECVRCLPPVPLDVFGPRKLELGEDHKELEAELKKMAPPNGRTVLIFRAPCGCPAGRMEVWGAKKVRRIKK